MIGTQIGALTIVRRLGEDRVGKLYLADHAKLHTQQVVKILSPLLTQNPALVRRFTLESRAVAWLRHRNVLQVHDVGELPTGACYVAHDHVDGRTLGQFMAAHAAPVPPHVVVHIVCEIANGLQAIHARRILHRDLTPESIFLVATESDPYHALLLDLGIAHLGDDLSQGPRARTGVVIGTPAYMSAEQLRGDPLTATSDVYALGVIAYQMSTGGWFPYQHHESRLRYGEIAGPALYHRQMTEPPIDPRERWSRLTAAWANALVAAVSANPDVRPASARMFALNLADALTGSSATDGRTIVQRHARELIDGSAGFQPIRMPRLRSVATTETGSRYQLGAKLGVGGMAEVFAGTMIGLEGFARPVAIKRVLPGLSQVPEFATMFIAEARIVSRLAHPNIVPVLDFSRDFDGRLFLVMEYVDGKDLASLLAPGPMPPALALFVAVEMLRGLGYAHDLPDPTTGARGVVHRDVSPQNLLISYEGAVKLSDFGLAKARAASQGVRSETVRGKPSYMAPEQISGGMLDGRTDLYAVGIMLWEMLAHRPLFAGTTREIMGQVLFRDIPVPSSVRGGVPLDLEAVTMKLLARDRDSRYATAEAAIEALLACNDVPRDGRGELAHLLAARFPRPSDARTQRAAGLPVAAAVAAPVAAAPPAVAGPVTAAAPPSIAGAPAGPTVPPLFVEHTELPARHRMIAATVSGFVLGIVAAAAVIALVIR
jgi:serine/threonine protein kinase